MKYAIAGFLSIIFAMILSIDLTQAASSKALGPFNWIYPGNEQKVAYDATTRSAAFGAKTSVIRMICSTDCHVKFGSAAAPTIPTAVADGTATFLKANIEYYFAVQPSSKIAIIKDASAGNAFISEGL